MARARIFLDPILFMFLRQRGRGHIFSVSACRRTILDAPVTEWSEGQQLVCLAICLHNHLPPMCFAVGVL